MSSDAFHKCPLCGRVGNGGYALDGYDVGPMCTGTDEVPYSCLYRVVEDNVTPTQIVGKALEKIFVGLWSEQLAELVAPWVVDCGESD